MYKLIDDYNQLKVSGEDTLGYDTGFHDTFWDIDIPVTEIAVPREDTITYDIDYAIDSGLWEDLEEIM